MASRSGSPGVRLGLAFATSIALHFAVLLPVDWPPPRAPQPTLTVSLPAFATRPEAEAEPAPPPEQFAAPPAPSIPPPPPPPPKELRGRALDTAMAALTREEFYPREAIARGLEGRVVLLLTFDAAGRLAILEIASSSGHPILDNAALTAAQRIGTLPGVRRQVLLPVEFRLE